MRKRLVTLCLTIGVCLMSTACGGDGSKSKETTSGVVTTAGSEETSSEVAETTTKKAEADSSEERESSTTQRSRWISSDGLVPFGRGSIRGTRFRIRSVASPQPL